MSSRGERRENNTAAPSTSSSSHSIPPLLVPSSAPSPSSVAAVGRECAKCLSYLTRALDGSGGGATLGSMMSSSTESSSSSSSSSRPATLLRALGVISPTIDERNNESESNNNVNNNSHRGSTNIRNSNNKMYELMPNGRGVMIRLQNNHSKNLNNNNQKSDHFVNEHDLQQRESMVGVTGDNSQQRRQQQHQRQQNQQLIHRRLSNAASHLADNNIQEGSGHSKGVLTTSPLSSDPSTTHSPQRSSSNKDSSSITITIECSPCGSDTRAEACARAYVRGPDPLGVVLCSNRLSSQREIEEVLVHELVHIYDVHVRQMDLRDCKQLAYSEVRAAREAECGNRMTSFTTNICAKDRAIVATRNMFPDEGKKCVCDVFDAAVKDYAPFLVRDTSGGGGAVGSGGLLGPNRRSSTISSVTFVSAPSPLSPPRSDR